MHPGSRYIGLLYPAFGRHTGNMNRDQGGGNPADSWKTPEFFERVVAETLEELPDEIYERLDNVVILVEDRSPDDEVLGLFEGVSLLERGNNYAGVLPDRISVFVDTHLALQLDQRETAEEIRRTVLHEIAHHLGIDDHRLHLLGWS